MLKKLIVILSILFSGLSIANTAAKTKQLDQALTAINESHNIPALSVAVIDKGEHLYTRGFGIQDNSKPVTEHTLFRIASITKLFTAQAIMQLVEKNKVKLDDDVAKYINLLSEKNIKIRDLLTHTSGLKDVIKPVSLAENRNFDTYLKQSLALNSEHDNRSFNYADLNFNILGKVIEIISNTTYSTYIELNILQTLGLAQSGFKLSTNNLTPDTQPSYNYGLVVNAPTRPYDISYLPSEGLISSVDELSKWLLSTLNQDAKLLQKNAFKEMLIPIRKTKWGKIEMGLGWQIYTKNKTLVAQHAGSITGYKSLLITHPETKRAIIILANAKNVPRWQIAQVINHILDDKQYELPTSDQGKYKTYILLSCFVLLLIVASLILKITRRKSL